MSAAYKRNNELFRKSLNKVFWGVLICIIDLRIGSFDLINDFIGLGMITIGVFELNLFSNSKPFKSHMKFVKVMCLLSFFTLVSYEGSRILPVLVTVISFLTLFAIRSFIKCFLEFSDEQDLAEARTYWSKALLWSNIINIGFIGTLHLISLMSQFQGKTENINSPFLLIPFILLLVPFVYFRKASKSMVKNLGELEIFEKNKGAQMSNLHWAYSFIFFNSFITLSFCLASYTMNNKPVKNSEFSRTFDARMDLLKHSKESPVYLSGSSRFNSTTSVFVHGKEAEVNELLNEYRPSLEEKLASNFKSHELTEEGDGYYTFTYESVENLGTLKCNVAHYRGDEYHINFFFEEKLKPWL